MPDSMNTSTTTSSRAADSRRSGGGSSNTIAQVLVVVCAVFLLGSGLFAMLAPEAFFNLVALYPPYNRHFIHDIGAFMLGLGSGLALALILTDALLVALAATAVGSVAHFVSHLADRELGGLPSDPVTFGVFALVVVALTVWRLRRVAFNSST
jgi:hypothetical protein